MRAIADLRHRQRLRTIIRSGERGRGEQEREQCKRGFHGSSVYLTTSADSDGRAQIDATGHVLDLIIVLHVRVTFLQRINDVSRSACIRALGLFADAGRKSTLLPPPL